MIEAIFNRVVIARSAVTVLVEGNPYFPHPERGELVPACGQHSVREPAETAALRAVLPMPTRRAGA